MLRMTVRLDPISGNIGTDFTCTETKGEVVIIMSGKYDFTVTCEVLIEMM
jgi:hypothetical protein